MDYVGAIIGVLGTILGGVLSYAAFHRNSKKDSEEEGKSSGTMLTEIGYIKGGIDRIERKQDAQDARYISMAERMSAVESSAKSAHHRIDRLEGREVWSFAKGYLSFSKLLVYAVLYIDYKSTMTTLDLCRISVANNYTGSLPYLTALIAFLQAATATVLSFSLNKSKAENTTGGITYDTATKRDC